jgi:hypothetical protein
MFLDIIHHPFLSESQHFGGTGFCLQTWGLSIDWAQLSRFYLKTETIQSLKRVLNKNRMMDNVQKHNTCISVPVSQPYRSY